MKTVMLIVLSSLTFISGVTHAESNKTQIPKTIEQCAHFLPNDGKEYEIIITGKVKADRKVTGEFSVSHGTNKNISEELKKSTQGFVDCVTKLLK